MVTFRSAVARIRSRLGAIGPCILSSEQFDRKLEVPSGCRNWCVTIRLNPSSRAACWMIVSVYSATNVSTVV